MTVLSVNVNKIALLRNARGGNVPDLYQFSSDLLDCGAQGITVHPRPDQRHIRYSDLEPLKELCDRRGVEFNVEGYPSEAFLAIVEKIKPAQATLVPDPPEALTSNAGWDCKVHHEFLLGVSKRLKSAGIRVSLFLEADPSQVEFAAKAGADRIELYTEDYASSFAENKLEQIFPAYRATADAAAVLGIGVNAGHDLDQYNLNYLASNISNLLEVSIGHALVAEMLYQGMSTTIAAYRKALEL